MATTQDHINTAVAGFQKAYDHLKVEFGRLQMGRASAALIEDVKVDAYGAVQPIKAVGSISIPDPRTIQIQPWDRGLMGAVEKAIQMANLGLNPVNDGKVIRIPMPPLNEERRKELVKVVHQMAEQAKISVRTSRADAHGAFKTLKEGDEITEDDQRLGEKHLQEKVDHFNKEIEELAKKKEQDIMTV